MPKDALRHGRLVDERDQPQPPTAALDETIESTFPASDPPSTIPNPDEDEVLEEDGPAKAGPHI